MLTEVEVCNQALAAAQVRSQITSLVGTDVPSKVCNLHYATTRDELLGEAQWDFATKFTLATLVATKAAGAWTASDPAPGWMYAYSMPADQLRIRWIIPRDEFSPALVKKKVAGWLYEVSADASGILRISTDAKDAIICYTWQVTDVVLWPEDFGQAMVARLAYRLAVPLGGDKVLANANYQLSLVRTADARAGDANESLTIINPYPDWIAARDL